MHKYQFKLRIQFLCHNFLFGGVRGAYECFRNYNNSKLGKGFLLKTIFCQLLVFILRFICQNAEKILIS